MESPTLHRLQDTLMRRNQEQMRLITSQADRLTAHDILVENLISKGIVAEVQAEITDNHCWALVSAHIKSATQLHDAAAALGCKCIEGRSRDRGNGLQMQEFQVFVNDFCVPVYALVMTMNGSQA